MYPLSRKDSKVAYISEDGCEFLRTLNFNIFNQLKDLSFYYHQNVMIFLQQTNFLSRRQWYFKGWYFRWNQMLRGQT